MQYTFQHKFVRMAPRKVRLVTNFVKDMKPSVALTQLKFLPKYAATPVLEIIKSAIASCKNEKIDEEKLYIKSITCDNGPALKRRRFKSRGRANGIKKRTSHIKLVIGVKENEQKTTKATKPKPTAKSIKDTTKVKNIVDKTNKKDK